MASCLQCLNQAEEFSEYFISGTYKSHINPSNPLGMRGMLAREYGRLVTQL
jgi:ubiquitin carboxyl-terminal hydrolase 4/11/15